MSKDKILVGLVALMLPLSITCAHADNNDNLHQKLASSRTPSDYQALGRNFKGFKVQPKLDIRSEYNDNIYAQETFTKSDWIYSITPSISILKEYGSNNFNFNGSYTKLFYAENKDENKDLYQIGTGGAFGITNSLDLGYKINSSKKYLARSTPGQSRYTTELIGKNETSAVGFLGYKFNRLVLKFGSGVTRQTYENGISQTTGQAIIFDNKDRNIYTASARAEYEILGQNSQSSDHTLFSEINYNDARYDDGANPVTGISSDSKKYGFLAGLQTAYKGIIFGSAGVGYFIQKFASAEDVARLDFDVDLSVNATKKLTLSINAGRDLREDNSFTTGYVETTGGLSADYEFFHNLYGGAAFKYGQNDFTGTQAGRLDKDYETSLYARYLHSRYFESNLEFNHTERNSNNVGSDFKQNSIIYRLISKL